MLSVVLFGAIGVSGVLYLLLNYFWPGWYLDYVYRKTFFKKRSAIDSRAAKGHLLIDIFEEVVAKQPEKAFIIYEDKTYSYGFMDKKANQVARAMVEIGVRPGATVAVMIHNEPAIVWTYLGLMKAGMQIAFINFNLRARSLAHCINVSGTKILLVGEGHELVSAVSDVMVDIPGISVYLQGATSEQKPPGFLSFELVLSRASPAHVDRVIRKHVNRQTTNCYIYTSGTTGLPKPAIVSQARCVAGGYSFNQFDMTSDDIVYQPLPMYHSAALMIGFGGTVTHGATMILKDKFSATHFWDDCRKHNVTVIQYIGEVCRYLLARPKSDLDGAHNVKVAYGNGLRQDIWLEFKNRFKIPRILEFYGATECPIDLCNANGQVGACGRSSPYMRKFNPCAFVKFDLESQSPLRNRQGRCIPIGPGELGLLVVPVIPRWTPFNGYKGKASDTEKKLLYDVFAKGDKYFNSGDLFRLDSNYYVYFSDRVGDTFRWKGENVSTTEVGNTLTELDFIQDANVYGVTLPGADGRAGMAAIILTEDNVSFTPAMLTALSNHVTKVLPSYAQPKFVRVMATYDMTSTHKQQKMALVNEGFDVNKVADPLFYLNPSLHTYLPLDEEVYSQIMEGQLLF